MGSLDTQVSLEKQLLVPFFQALQPSVVPSDGQGAGGVEGPMVQVLVLEVEELVECGACAEVVCGARISLHTEACRGRFFHSEMWRSKQRKAVTMCLCSLISSCGASVLQDAAQHRPAEGEEERSSSSSLYPSWQRDFVPATHSSGNLADLAATHRQRSVCPKRITLGWFPGISEPHSRGSRVKKQPTNSNFHQMCLCCFSHSCAAVQLICFCSGQHVCSPWVCLRSLKALAQKDGDSRKKVPRMDAAQRTTQ